MVLSSTEYREVIAFGVVRLLEKWAAAGTLGRHGLAEVIEEQYEPIHHEVRDIYKILDLMRNEIHSQLKTLQQSRGKVVGRKRKISHWRSMLSCVDSVWDEFRIKTLDRQQEIEGTQVM